MPSFGFARATFAQSSPLGAAGFGSEPLHQFVHIVSEWWNATLKDGIIPFYYVHLMARGKSNVVSPRRNEHSLAVCRPQRCEVSGLVSPWLGHQHARLHGPQRRSFLNSSNRPHQGGNSSQECYDARFLDSETCSATTRNNGQTGFGGCFPNFPRPTTRLLSREKNKTEDGALSPSIPSLGIQWLE